MENSQKYVSAWFASMLRLYTLMHDHPRAAPFQAAFALIIQPVAIAEQMPRVVE